MIKDERTETFGKAVGAHYGRSDNVMLPRANVLRPGGLEAMSSLVQVTFTYYLRNRWCRARGRDSGRRCCARCLELPRRRRSANKLEAGSRLVYQIKISWYMCISQT